MKTPLVWIIGKDQYTEALIHYLKEIDDILISTTNVEYVDDKVRILSPCDMNDLKADIIVLPYSNNISIGKFGRLQLNNDFYEKQKDAIFFTSAISNYSKIFVSRNKIKLYSLFDLDEVKEVKKKAIIDLIIYGIIENSEIMLQHLDIGIINDKDITPYLMDYLNNLKINYVLGESIDKLLDQNIIIVPDGIEIKKQEIDKYKNYPFLIINLYEDNISFSVIKNAQIQRLYSLRLTSYAKLSYAYAFSRAILNKMKEE